MDLLSGMLASLRESMVAPYPISMHMHNLTHRFDNDCLFAEGDVLLFEDIHLQSPLELCGH